LPIKIDGRIRDVIGRDKKVIMTTTREHFPFVPERGNGDYVFDVSGNKFIDFSTFIGVYTFGVNANAEIREAIKNQVDKLIHPAFTDYYSELPVTYAEKLLEFFPESFGRVFYSNSGTEAIEDAIKLSRIFTKRKYLLAFYGAFHGRSMGSLSLTTSKVAQRANTGPFLSGVVRAPFPYPYRCRFHSDDPDECGKESLDYIEKVVFASEVPANEVAAIFFEPVQGEGGYIVPPRKFFKGLRELADKYGILLVDDEIQAGCMKTGKFIALDHFKTQADIYVMAKAIGGGVPMGVTLAKTEFGDVPPGEHAGTFGGNLLALASANATLDYVKKNLGMLESAAKRKGAYTMKRLEQMKESYEIVGDVRGIGMMIGVELVKDKRSKDYAVSERDKVIETCFYNGLILLPTGTSSIRVIPPLTIKQENLERGVDILEQAIKKVNSERGHHD
jgi:4-aminobutyrate aminotransferase